MYNILLTGIGGVTPQSIAKSLRITEEKYKIVGVDANKYANGLFMYDLIDESYLVPKINNDNYFDVINKIIKKESIDLVIVSPDEEVEVVSKYRNKINTKLILPPDELVQIITNKQKTADYLSEINFTPQSLIINNKDDLKKASEELGIPFWIREYKGTSGIGSLKVDSIKKAIFWIDLNNGWGNFMAAEYLPGKNFGFQCIYKDGELITSATQDRMGYVMSKVSPSGITGNASIGKFVAREDVNEIGEKAINYICDKLEIKPHGMMTIDMKEDKNGVPKITEINPRHIATTYCFSKAGANFSELMVKIGLDLPIGNIEKYNLAKTDHYFLRAVDAEPVIVTEEQLQKKNWI